jgi:hypothetical protein
VADLLPVAGRDAEAAAHRLENFDGSPFAHRLQVTGPRFR